MYEENPSLSLGISILDLEDTKMQKERREKRKKERKKERKK